MTPAGCLHLLGLLLFVAAAVCAFPLLQSQDRRHLQAIRLAAFMGAALQVAALVLQGALTGRFPVRGADESFFLLSGAVVLVALVLDWSRGLTIVLVATLPLAAVTALLGFILQQTAPASAPPAQTFSGIWTSLHIVVALGSYGAFALSFVSGVLYLVSQRQLKEHASTLGLMPALETVSRLNTRSIAIGVVLLTGSLLVGYLQARSAYAGRSEWRMDPKIILTTLTVLAYVAVLALARRPGFKGRRAALASIFGFLLVMTTFWASIFWSGFHTFR